MLCCRAGVRLIRKALLLDARSLALARVGLALVLLGDLIARAADLATFYSDLGVLPRELLGRATQALPSFHSMGGSPTFEAVLFGVAGLSAVLFGLGWNTRWTCIASWVLLVSLQNRNPFVFHAGDNLLRLTLFWAMFIPFGRVGSLDAVAAKDQSPPQTAVFSPASVGLLLQVVMVFACTLDFKLHGVSWSDGTAVRDALEVKMFARPLAEAMLAHPLLLQAATWATLVAQGGLPILLLVPFFPGPARTAGVVGIVLMQIGLGVFLRLGLFPFITSVCALALLPSSWWDRLPTLRPAPGLLARFAIGILPWAQPRPVRLLLDGIAAAALGLIVLWNMGESGAFFDVDGNRLLHAGNPQRLVLLLRLDQRWAMFAPNPQTEDGWFSVDAAEPGGSRDLLPGLSTSHVVSPVADAQLSQRWLLFLVEGIGTPHPGQFEALGQLACRASPSAAGVEVAYHRFDHRADGSETPIERLVLFRAPCPG